VHTGTDVVSIGRYTLELERPLDPECLLDEERFADDEYMPYWAELWPSGVALAEYLAQPDLDPAGKRVLEIGCGLGLPSLVAALRGADVLATDWSPEAVDLLHRNAARNGTSVQARVEDWRHRIDTLTEGFDLVCAADVLYEERYVEPLRALVATAVRAGAEVLIADPGRRHAAGFAESLGPPLVVRHVPAAAVPRGDILVVGS
jgi:predicted nicotinamide N-methyase